MVKYYIEKDASEFDFWGGALDRMTAASEEQKELVYERIEEYTSDGTDWTETAINDIVLFDCDDIFFPEDDEDE